MKALNGNGPGGRVARAEKKVAKAAKNLISSRDTPSEYDRKKAIQGKTEAKVAKAVSKLGNAKAAVTKKVEKLGDKETKRLGKDISEAKKIAGNIKYQKKVGALQSDKTTKAVGRSLSDLNKFDKKINVSKLAKEAKPAAKDFNKMLKNRK